MLVEKILLDFFRRTREESVLITRWHNFRCFHLFLRYSRSNSEVVQNCAEFFTFSPSFWEDPRLLGRPLSKSHMSDHAAIGGRSWKTSRVEEKSIRSTKYSFCGTKYLSHCRSIYLLRFTLVSYDIIQPTLVSNSNISLNISTFGSRDVVGHVAVRPTAIYRVL